MIVLDTNVISEAIKPMPHPEVRAWLNDQAIETLYLSSVTMAELLFGIEAMPIGKRKDMLTQNPKRSRGNVQRSGASFR